MHRFCALLALALLPCAAGARQFGKNQIDVRVRPAGAPNEWADHLSFLHPDSSPVDVDVGVFYYSSSEIGVASAMHSIVGSPYSPGLGDLAEIIDNPLSTLHPDGRYAGYNYGAQRQSIYHTGNAGVDANRFRVAAFGNPNDLIAGGISARQAHPPMPSDFPPPDLAQLAYLVHLRIACAPDGFPRTITLDVPRNRIRTYTIFGTINGDPQDELRWLLDTDPATVTISVPAPPVFAAALIGGASLLARRRSRVTPFPEAVP